MSLWRYTCRRAPCRTASRAPSMMDAWFSASEKMWQPAPPASAAIVPALAANPVGNSRAASLPADGHLSQMGPHIEHPFSSISPLGMWLLHLVTSSELRTGC